MLFNLSTYFLNNFPLATIQFRMRRLNFPITRCRILAGIYSMISLTCSLVDLTLTVTKETYVEMFQKIFPEDFTEISSESVFNVHAGRSTSTEIGDSNEVVEGSLSRETDHAEIRTHLAPKFTRSETLTISFLGLYEIM